MVEKLARDGVEPETDVQVEIAQSYIRLSQPRHAIHHARRALDLSPSDGIALLVLQRATLDDSVFRPDRDHEESGSTSLHVSDPSKDDAYDEGNRRMLSHMISLIMQGDVSDEILSSLEHMQASMLPSDRWKPQLLSLYCLEKRGKDTDPNTFSENLCDEVNLPQEGP